MWKWMGMFLKKNHLLRFWGWLSLLNWIGAFKLSLLLKLRPRKLKPWFVLCSFFLLRLLCICINLSCMEYCCRVWAGIHSCYLELLGCARLSVLRCTCCLSLTLGWSLKCSQLKSFLQVFFGSCSSELAQLVPLSYSRGRSTRYSDRFF